MLCQFQVYSKVIQLYIYIYTYIHSFFRFFSHIGHYRALSRFRVLYSRSLLVMCFIYGTVYMSVPISQFIPPPPL